MWSRVNGLKKQLRMPQIKEMHKQMQNKLIEICQSGNDYRAISQALGLQWKRDKVTDIIYKRRKIGKSGEPSKEWPVYKNPSKSMSTTHQGGPKEPRKTSKGLQASIALINVLDSTTRTTLGKNGINGRVSRYKPLLIKKNTKTQLTFAKNCLDDPQDFYNL